MPRSQLRLKKSTGDDEKDTEADEADRRQSRPERLAPDEAYMGFPRRHLSR